MWSPRRGRNATQLPSVAATTAAGSGAALNGHGFWLVTGNPCGYETGVAVLLIDGMAKCRYGVHVVPASYRFGQRSRWLHTMRDRFFAH